MNEFISDPIILNYINRLRELVKVKKTTIQVINGKATTVTPRDPVEEQTRLDFNAYIKLKYPEMAFVKDARVKIKHIPDDCGLENKGVILTIQEKIALVRLDNDKQAEYAIANLELL